MMKQFALAFLSVLFFSDSFSQAGKQIYEAPNLKSILQQQKNVAILPLHVTISYKKFPKDYNAVNNAVQEKEEALNMQEGMYTYLLKRSKDYTVRFQDIQRTNILLKQAGVFDKLETLAADSICKILKVDGVIQASYAYKNTRSETAAIVNTFILGFDNSTGSGALTMQINNRADGALLWRFYKGMNESVFSSGNELMVRMMKKVARNFPYEN